MVPFGTVSAHIPPAAPSVAVLSYSLDLDVRKPRTYFFLSTFLVPFSDSNILCS